MRFPAMLLVVLLAGCGSQQPLPSTGVVSWQDERAAIPGRLVTQTRTVFARLRAESGANAVLKIDGSPVANAYVTARQGQPWVIINAGLIDMIGYDSDEMAFVLAHELAHLDRGHLRQVHRAEREKRRGAADVVGTLAGFFIPLAGVAVDAGYALVEAGYSRDDEREADAVGLDLMVRAGFDPQGGLRFQRKLAAVSGKGLPLLSTHPSGRERVERLEQLIEAAEAR